MSASCKQRLLGNLRNGKDDGNENVTFDYYFKSLNLYKNSELPRLVGVEFDLRKRFEILRRMLTFYTNLEFGHFKLLF